MNEDKMLYDLPAALALLKKDGSNWITCGGVKAQIVEGQLCFFELNTKTMLPLIWKGADIHSLELFNWQLHQEPKFKSRQLVITNVEAGHVGIPYFVCGYEKGKSFPRVYVSESFDDAVHGNWGKAIEEKELVSYEEFLSQIKEARNG